MSAHRRPLAFLLALSLLALGGCYKRPGVFRDRDTGGNLPKARSVAELSDRYASEHCEKCHGAIYDEWKRSIHSRSIFGTGRTAATLSSTVKNGFMEWSYSGVKGNGDLRVKDLMGCAKCHLPQLAEATDNVAVEIVDDIVSLAAARKEGDDRRVGELETKLKSLNLGCLTCHNTKAIVHKWADGKPEPRTVYGVKGQGHFCGFYPYSKTSATLKESIFCGQCHGQGPNFEFDNPTQCATAYSSYLFSYRSRGGKEDCQDCHMRKFKQGHDIASYKDPRMIEAFLEFSVAAASGPVWDGERIGPGVVAGVTILNKAGHGIPDG